MAYQMEAYAAMLDREFASSSPAPSMSRSQIDDQPRPMNLRIHYTFDLKGEKPCLTKLQHALPIRSVAMPGGSQIGAASLKTCLQAVLKASPEIDLEETDYAVYAFDPSEVGSPRVGHGRLSQIIQEHGAPADEPDMVMGTVKHNLALLATSHQVQDNLEIRLALTPVQTRGRTETGSMSPFLQDRAPSPLVTGFPDPNNLMNLGTMDPQYWMYQQAAANQQNASANSAALQRFMAPSLNQFQPARPATSNSFNNFPPLQQRSRPTSPALSVASNRSGASRRGLKRTASNVSKSNVPDLPSALSQVNTEQAEEVSAPKRVRTKQVDRPGKNVLNKKGDLRMVASTAASVRMHQPTAIRPNGQSTKALEEPQRLPTPVPQGKPPFLQRRASSARSSLGLHAENSFSLDAVSPYSESNLPSMPNSAATSPEGMFGANDSPAEIGSSPPVMHDSEACPSSPALPPMLPHDDSGFMSGGLMDMSEMENEFAEDQNQTRGTMLPPKRRKGSVGVVSQESKVLQDSTPNIQAFQQSAAKARNAIALKKLTPPPSSDLPLDSEPSKKRGRPSRVGSERAPWDKEKRRMAMVARLNNSVANGEIPPYCHNCGNIETSAWRRAYTKIHSGEAPLFKIPKGGVKEEGAIIGLEILKVNAETQKCEVFRIYKKTLLSDDEGFESIIHCNPCGLWIKNRGINRPEKLWNKGDDGDESKSQEYPEREKRPRLARGDEEPQSDFVESANLPSEATPDIPTLDHHQESLMSEFFDETPDMLPEELPAVESEQDTTTELPAVIPEAPKSRSPTEAEKITPANRIRPMELDEQGQQDPSPIRRSLFSSPRSDGPLGVDIRTRTPKTPEPPKPPKTPTIEETNVSAELDEPEDIEEEEEEEDPLAWLPELEEGEKYVPMPTTFQALADLQPFDWSTTPQWLPPNLSSVFGTPTKDASFSRSPSNLFKTPSSAASGLSNAHRVTTSDFFSSSAKSLLHGASPNTTPTKSRPAPSSVISSATKITTSPSRAGKTFQKHKANSSRSGILGQSKEPLDPKDRVDPTRGITYRQAEELYKDCCPHYPYHKLSCKRRTIMLNSEYIKKQWKDGRPDDLDEDIRLQEEELRLEKEGKPNPRSERHREEDAIIEAFFNSDGITGFTPRKP